jgi:hypothetical protein
LSFAVSGGNVIFTANAGDIATYATNAATLATHFARNPEGRWPKSR